MGGRIRVFGLNDLTRARAALSYTGVKREQPLLSSQLLIRQPRQLLMQTTMKQKYS